MTLSQSVRAVAALAGAGAVLTGCGFGGLNSMVLPGSEGTGDSGYVIEVEFASVANLVPNSEVKVNDVTVGTVRSISLDGWHARASLGLRRDVVLPANAVAMIGQKSLLGAEYIELAAPTAEPPAGRLRDGDVIKLAQTDRYPETEEVLASLSMLLNGGGLAQVKTIVTEANHLLDGNVVNTRRLIENLNTFVGSLDRQRDQIARAIDAMHRLTAKLAARSSRIGAAIDKIGPGIRVLDEQQAKLVDALAALDKLGTVGTKVITASRKSLLADLRALQPTLNRLVEAGESVPKSLDLLGTFLFPIKAVPYVTKGDYLNSANTVDVSLPALSRGLLPGTPLEHAVRQLHTALQASDPLTAPLTDAVNGATGDMVLPAPSSRQGSTTTATRPSTSTPPPTSSSPDTSDGLLGSLLGGS